jgi:hypothetical protein
MILNEKSPHIGTSVVCKKFLKAAAQSLRLFSIQGYLFPGGK